MRTFNKFLYNLSLLMIMSCFLSCVREEIIPYKKEAKNKLVVVGLISPGQTIMIYVGKSQPFGKNDYKLSDFNELNAIVTISNSSGQHQKLSLNSSNSSVYSCSQLDFAIVPGKTYSISIRTSLDEVTAETTVPTASVVWKDVKLTGPQEYNYYTFSGTWNGTDTPTEINYGVSLSIENGNIEGRTNEGVTMINGIYRVKKEIYLAKAESVNAVLLTRDKYFGEFSRKSDLTLEVIENLNSAAFTDVISGFKGIIPSAGNIRGGIGVFGSYLKDVKRVNK